MRSLGIIRKFVLARAAFAVAASVAGAAFAGANNYEFEPVKTEIKSSNVATVAVRLVHKPGRKPVTDAVIVQTRLDMAPDGMASMTAAHVPLPSPEPGVYAFKAPLTMAGRWLLTISAKVQGESDPVVGNIIFKVAR
jgi:YtkA-like protein